MKKMLLLLLLVTEFSYSQSEVSQKEDARSQYLNLLNTKYVLLPHKGTFLLPYVFNSMPHESIYKDSKKLSPENDGDLYKKNEAEFQISFLLPLERKVFDTNIDINLAYTHHAWWQIYNSEWSRPFRETNYMPELFGRYVDDKERSFAGFNLVAIDFGYVHQSNGQIQVLSRSWDRIFARTFFQRNSFLVVLTGWYRLPEKRDQDDNPDIYNYMGLGEVEINKSLGKHTLALKAPLLSHHLSTDIKYSYPWKDRLRWYLSVQHGYGHSLIEYNRPTQRYGVGIVLDNLMNSIVD